jgi:uncharacterized membrane protein
MRPERLMAFTDGVVAILITVLVLELKPPHGTSLGDIVQEKGRLLAYLLSFVFAAIYWMNHHHLFQVVHRVDGRVLWANVHLLFWLSLIPVTTAWLGDAGVKSGSAAAYAVVQLGCALAYFGLTLALLAQHESESDIHRAIGDDRKGKVSLVAYMAAVALAFVTAWASVGLLIAVAVSWLIPDRRVTRALGGSGPRPSR